MCKSGQFWALILSAPPLLPGRALPAGTMVWGHQEGITLADIAIKGTFYVALFLQSDSVQVRLQGSAGISSSVVLIAATFVCSGIFQA